VIRYILIMHCEHLPCSELLSPPSIRKHTLRELENWDKMAFSAFLAPLYYGIIYYIHFSSQSAAHTERVSEVDTRAGKGEQP
jgi:hypothetical protein